MNKYEKLIKDSLYKVLYQFRKIKSSFFIFLSREFLKNEGGLDLYLWGKAKHACIKLLCARKKSSTHLSEDNKKIVSFLHENKYAPVTLNIPEDIIREIQEKANRYIEDKNFSYVRGARQGNTENVYYTRAMKKVVEVIPDIKKIITPELEAIISSYFGTNIGMTSVLFWRNYHIPDNMENRVFFSNDWHNDNISPTELKLFVNVTDVTENHGPLHVIGAPATRKLVAQKAFKGRKKDNDISALENKAHIIKHVGKAGSAVFAHASYCLHRADIPGEGNYRDMLEFQFHPAIKPLDKDWDKNPLKYQ